jgi:hypothetical protein
LCREVSIKTADPCWENSHERENCKFLPYISSLIFFLALNLIYVLLHEICLLCVIICCSALKSVS